MERIGRGVLLFHSLHRIKSIFFTAQHCLWPKGGVMCDAFKPLLWRGIKTGASKDKKPSSALAANKQHLHTHMTQTTSPHTQQCPQTNDHGQIHRANNKKRELALNFMTFWGLLNFNKFPNLTNGRIQKPERQFLTSKLKPFHGAIAFWPQASGSRHNASYTC